MATQVDFKNTYVAIGAFDGIHFGHRELIGKAVEDAKKNGGSSVVFTFANHPLEIIDVTKTPQLINSTEEKIHLLKMMGVDYLVLQPFTKSFASMTPFSFVENILKKKLDAKEILVGFNFSFGKGGAGTPEDLKKMGEFFDIKTTIVPPIKRGESLVSSTLIRQLLQEGNLDEVNDYLGYPYLIIGEVVHGKKLGRTLGFPTANLEVLNKLYPPFGIYGAKVLIEGETEDRWAVVNIGKNPTLKPGSQSIEVHILDFNEYIYGKKIYLKLLKHLRDEKKFSSVDELKAVINNDVLNWKNYIKEENYGTTVKN